MRHVMTYGVVSEVGLKKAINQDRILIKIGQVGAKDFGLFAIADGLGGHAHGEIASTMAIAELKKWWNHELENILRHNKSPWNEVKGSLAECFNNINTQIRTVSSDKMGTTLTVLFIYGDKYVITHVGDSRIYRTTHRDIIQITKDHSLMDKRNTADSIKGYRHILTQCLGIQERVYPYTQVSTHDHKALFLLCSDGLYNYMTREMMTQIIYQGIRSRKQLQEIVDHLYKKVLENGAGDNVSIMLVQDRNTTWRK